MLHGHGPLAIVAAMILALAWSFDAAAEVGLDWKVQHLVTTPSATSTITEKSHVTVRCEWTAGITKDGSMSKPIEWTGFLLVDGQMIKKFTVKYPVKSGYWFGPGKYATATNEFDGAAEGVWEAKGVGNHTIRCEVAKVGNALETMTNATNNQKEIVIPIVAPKTVEPGTWPTAPKSSGKPKPGNQQAAPGGPPIPR